MNESDNPYESPRAELRPRNTIRRIVQSRYAFLLASMFLVFVAPACLPDVHAKGRERSFVEISSLTGLVILCQIWSMILGWLSLLVNFRKAAAVLGAATLATLLVFPFVDGFDTYRVPAYWTWLASCAVLIAGGLQKPSRKPDQVVAAAKSG